MVSNFLNAVKRNRKCFCFKYSTYTFVKFPWIKYFAIIKFCDLSRFRFTQPLISKPGTFSTAKALSHGVDKPMMTAIYACTHDCLSLDKTWTAFWVLSWNVLFPRILFLNTKNLFPEITQDPISSSQGALDLSSQQWRNWLLRMFGQRNLKKNLLDFKWAGHRLAHVFTHGWWLASQEH